MEANHLTSNILPTTYQGLSEGQTRRLGVLHGLYVKVLQGEGRNLQTLSQLIQEINNVALTAIKGMPSHADAIKLGQSYIELNKHLIHLLSCDEALMTRMPRFSELLNIIDNCNRDINTIINERETAQSSSDFWSGFKGALGTLASLPQAIALGTASYTLNSAVSNIISSYSIQDMTKSLHFPAFIDTNLAALGNETVIGKAIKKTTLDQQAISTIQNNIKASLQPLQFTNLLSTAVKALNNGANALGVLRDIEKQAESTSSASWNPKDALEKIDVQIVNLKHELAAVKEKRQKCDKNIEICKQSSNPANKNKIPTLEAKLKNYDRRIAELNAKQASLELMSNVLLGKASMSESQLTKFGENLQKKSERLKSKIGKQQSIVQICKAKISKKIGNVNKTKEIVTSLEESLNQKISLYNGINKEYKDFKKEKNKLKKFSLTVVLLSLDKKKEDETTTKLNEISVMLASKKSEREIAKMAIKKTKESLKDARKNLANAHTQQLDPKETKAETKLQIEALKNEYAREKCKLAKLQSEYESTNNLIDCNSNMIKKLHSNDALMTPFIEAMTGKPHLTKKEFCKSTRKNILKNLEEIVSNPSLSLAKRNVLATAIWQLPVSIGVSILGEKFLSMGQLQAGQLLANQLDGVQSWLNIASQQGGLLNSAMELVILDFTDKILEEMVHVGKMALQQAPSQEQEQKQIKDAKGQLNDDFDRLMETLDKLKDSSSWVAWGASKVINNIFKGTDFSELVGEPLRKKAVGWVTAPATYPVLFYGKLDREILQNTLLSHDAIGKAIWVMDPLVGPSVVVVRLKDTEGGVNFKKVSVEGCDFNTCLQKINAELNSSNIVITKESFM